MLALWLLLRVCCFALASVLPREVINGWVGEGLDLEARMRFAAFVSTLGTLAGALGGEFGGGGPLQGAVFL